MMSDRDKVLSLIITSGKISKELEEIFSHPEYNDRLIIGGYLHEDKATFLRGDMEYITVPLSFFDKCTSFDDFDIIDCGQTVKFGDYEAASEAILSFNGGLDV